MEATKDRVALASGEVVSIGIKREAVDVSVKREVLDRALFNVSKWEPRMKTSLTMETKGPAVNDGRTIIWRV